MSEGNFGKVEFDPKGKLTMSDGCLTGFGAELKIKLQHYLK